MNLSIIVHPNMKLTLHNFKCYSEKELEFQESTTTLIHGVSGVGKTTILDAIYFAITGNGNKIISIGKTSCKVELEYGGMKIVRSKRPNKVVVQRDGKSYEGEEAEAIIRRFYGQDFFYLQQDVRNSFVLMTPLDKITFLEKLLFSDIDISALKQDAKNNIRECETKLSEAQTKVKIFTKMVEEQKPQETLPAESMEQIDSELVEGEKKYKRQISEISMMRYKISEITTAQALLESKRVLLTQSRRRLQDLQTEIDSNLTPEQLKQKEQKYKSKLETLKTFKRIDKLKMHIKDERIYLEREIEKKRQEFQIYLGETSNLEERLEKANMLKEQLELYSQLKNEHENILVCPGCQTTLKMEGGTLVMSDSHCCDSRLEELEKTFRDCKDTVESVNKEIYRIRRQKETREKILDKMDKKIFVPELEIKTQNNIRMYTEELDALELSIKDVEKVTETKEEIMEKLESIQQAENNITVLRVQKAQIKDQISSIDMTIKELEKRLKSYDTVDSINQKLEILSQYNESWPNHQVQLHAKKQLIERFTKYRKTQDELEEAINHEKQLEMRHKASLIYRSKILEAESITMENIVDAFNSHLKMYLDQFFDDPIDVVLALSSDEKKVNKYQLQLNVNYRGMECDIHTLSGGEKDRVIVAGTLALCEIANSPLVMLDESIRSLDAETVNNVVQVLNKFDERMVLLISHQVVSGVFASTLEIK